MHCFYFCIRWYNDSLRAVAGALAGGWGWGLVGPGTWGWGLVGAGA